MKVEFAFSDHIFTASIAENPSARDFASMLPLDLMIEDYSTNEKIAYLPRKLTEEGSGAFTNEAPGDLCYYAPWGNLVFYYAGYRFSRGLIRLGRLDNGVAPLLSRGKFRSASQGACNDNCAAQAAPRRPSRLTLWFPLARLSRSAYAEPYGSV